MGTARWLFAAAAVLLPAVLAQGPYGERQQAERAQQTGADIGLRALRAVSRGGAGGQSAKTVSASEIYESFLQGLQAGVYQAPHDEWEEVKEASMNIDPLFTTNVGLDIAASILAISATIAAAASGIGGGGMLVPIFLLVLGFHVSSAVPLSNATIFGNAIANIIINFPLRHPTADRPLVDFDLALILIPMDLTGSLIGVLLNLLFPQWLTIVCLLGLLSVTTTRTYKKGRATWDKENKERRRLARLEDARLAQIGDSKSVVLTHEGQEIGLKLVNGDSAEAVKREVLDLFAVKGAYHPVVADLDGETLRSFEYNTVDDEHQYTVRFVEVLQTDDVQVNYGFRNRYSTREPTGTEPTDADHARLIVLEPGPNVSRRRYLGKGHPIAHWTTEMVLSWVQTFTDQNDALCYSIDSGLISGTDLTVWSTNPDVGHADLERLGVAVESDRALILSHLTALADEDYMLLVHSSDDLPWGSWNRSSEWRDGDEQLPGRDLDGWLPDDPNHPKCRPATYVGSDSYVSVFKWDVEDVLRWLDKVTDYNFALKEAVRKNDVDGNALMHLSSEDLKGLGVPQLGPRLGLLARIAELDMLKKEHTRVVMEERHIPYTGTLLVLFLCWLLLLVLSILRGGGKSGGQSPVAGWEGKTQAEFCGSPTFWVLWWIGAPILAVVTYLAGNHLLDKHRRKVKTHYAFHEGDISWTEKRVRLFPAVMISAGIMAGLLGVGGAMVTGPVMLELGVIPRVATATSSFMIIYTSGVSAIAYVSLGTLPIDYAIWFAVLGATGAALGLSIIGMLLKKYNRQSLVIWSLTFVFILAAIGTVVAGYVRLSKDITEGGNLGFRQICN